MEIEMAARAIEFTSQEDAAVLELKAISALPGTEEHILLNDLAGAHLTAGLIVNFGEKSLMWKRAVMEANHASA